LKKSLQEKKPANGERYGNEEGRGKRENGSRDGEIARISYVSRGIDAPGVRHSLSSAWTSSECLTDNDKRCNSIARVVISAVV